MVPIAINDLGGMGDEGLAALRKIAANVSRLSGTRMAEAFDLVLASVLQGYHEAAHRHAVRVGIEHSGPAGHDARGRRRSLSSPPTSPAWTAAGGAQTQEAQEPPRRRPPHTPARRRRSTRPSPSDGSPHPVIADASQRRAPPLLTGDGAPLPLLLPPPTCSLWGAGSRRQWAHELEKL